MIIRKLLYLFLLAGTIFGCKTQFSPYTTPVNLFKNKYAEFLEPGEKEINSAYHYVTTRAGDKSFIMRTFFPETRQITSKVTYFDKALTQGHGPAKYWHENGHPKAEGMYQNSNKEGVWRYYHRANGNLSRQGSYAIGKETGLWKFFNEDGYLQEEVNYVNGIKEGKFIVYDSLQTIVNEGIYRNDEIFEQTKVDTFFSNTIEEVLPYLAQCHHITDEQERRKCSDEALLKHVYTSLRYPRDAREYGIQGRTFVQFVIDKNGDVKDIDVVIGLCQSLKEATGKVAETLPKWKPGIQQGEPVDVQYTLPVTFRLEN